MKKVLLVMAAALCTLGLTVLTVSFVGVGFDFQKLDTVEPSSEVYEFAEGFDRIVLGVNTADVRFVVSEDGVARVATAERSDKKHSVLVTDGKLIIRASDEAWYKQLFGFYFGKEEITVYLPEKTIYSLMAKSSTGDVTLSSGLAFNNVDIETNTGDIRVESEVRGLLLAEIDTGYVFIENTRTASIKVEGDTSDVTICNMQISGRVDIETDTGDVKLKNTIVTGNMNIETDTGDIRFDKADAANLYLVTSTGDVEGTLLSDKIFDVKTQTGDKELPGSANGGLCKIRSSTGDIEIDIVK